MKDWWLNLALREKQTVAVGSIFVFLFLLYEIIFSPLINANENLRVRIQHNRNTLNVMQHTDQLIQHLQNDSQKKHNQPTATLLGTLQTEINQSMFASHVVQLRQSENDSVQFNLRKINFDQFLVFLTSLWKTHGFIVSQITVNPTGTPGEVTVDVVMKSHQL